MHPERQALTDRFDEPLEGVLLLRSFRKPGPLKPEACIPKSSKKPESGMASPRPLIVNACACAILPVRKRSFAGKISAPVKAQPLN